MVDFYYYCKGLQVVRELIKDLPLEGLFYCIDFTMRPTTSKGIVYEENPHHRSKFIYRNEFRTVRKGALCRRVRNGYR